MLHIQGNSTNNRKVKPMNKLLRLLIFFGVSMASFAAGFSQSINFQFRDTSGPVGNFIDIPVTATTTFTGKEVFSYNLQFSFSSSVLSPEGVVTTGTISASFGNPAVNTSVPGQITIAGFGGTALSGSGNFIFLRFKILGGGTTSIINTGTANNFFNEGDPTLVFENGCSFTGIEPPVILITPNTDVLLKGETRQFSASGGTLPYSWSVTNAAVSSISSSGLLTATQVGFTQVRGTDANNNKGLSDNIEIRGYRLSIWDTTGLYNSYLNIPVKTTSLSGLNVISGSVNLSYPPADLTEIQIITANSLLQSYDTTTNLSNPGSIAFAFSGTSALSGSGVLFWIKCKLANPAGASAALTFQNVIFNEDLPAITQDGHISYSQPDIAISPNSGQLVFGDSLQLAVTGTNLNPPFTWSVSDPSLATISTTGILKAKQSGQISVSVSDANVSSATSGIFQLYDTYVKIADTSGTSGIPFEVPVTIKTLPQGQAVFGVQGKIKTSDPSIFSLTEIISSSFTVDYVVGADYINFSMYGISPVQGNSVLFKVKGVGSETAPVGATAVLSFQDFLINEGTPLPFLLGGSVLIFHPYTFTGNGNWNVASNWKNNLVPPALLTAGEEIIIDPVPGGECVLNIAQNIPTGTKITVRAGKKLRITGNLDIVQ